MQIALGLVSAGIAYAGIAGVYLSQRTALIALMVVGMTLCALGMKPDKYPFTNPFMIAGSLVGAVALLIGLAGIFGFKLPYVTDARAALIGVTALMALKVAIALLRGAAA
ncbi:MAG TPA: hypothetical protein VD969_20120 [Symbiobacteriaceae bacterium]|nr:hypothetical protein [Symbiobacteriaceae bacterium]